MVERAVILEWYSEGIAHLTMKDPSGNKSCREGGEEEERSQHTSENPDEQASSQISEAENDRGNSPRERHPQDSGSQAVQGCLHSRTPVEASVVAEQAAVAPLEEQAPIIPGPSGDAAATAEVDSWSCIL